MSSERLLAEMISPIVVMGIASGLGLVLVVLCDAAANREHTRRSFFAWYGGVAVVLLLLGYMNAVANEGRAVARAAADHDWLHSLEAQGTALIAMMWLIIGFVALLKMSFSMRFAETAATWSTSGATGKVSGHRAVKAAVTIDGAPPQRGDNSSSGNSDVLLHATAIATMVAGQSPAHTTVHHSNHCAAAAGSATNSGSGSSSSGGDY